MTAPAVVVPGALRISAARAAGLALIVAALAAVQLPWRPSTLCLLRAVTGIPCPVCGSTTAVVELGSGAPLRAFAASPLATLGAVALALQPAWSSRWRPGRRTVWVLIGAVGALSEVWQLHRFGWL